MLVKVGSNGADVVRIQKKVGVSADGAFGERTKQAVMQWQKAHGLTADGIVGDSTWRAMFGEAMPSKAVHPAVAYNPLSVHVTRLQGRPIKYLAIHFTAGSQSRDCVNIIKKVFTERNASADFAVDDKQMMQYNPDPLNYYCWAVGDKRDASTGGGSLYGIATNRNTISIEICSSKKSTKTMHANEADWFFTDAALANAVRLTKILMEKYHIPIERVVRHYDVSGKLCPGMVGWNDGRLPGSKEKNNSSEWQKFKARLR